MKNSDSTISTHVFVCTNKKTAGACCADRGGEKLRDDLKEWLRSQPEISGRVRINASGCLGKCAQGIATVIYPQKEWLVEITPADIEPLKAKIIDLAK